MNLIELSPLPIHTAKKKAAAGRGGGGAAGLAQRKGANTEVARLAAVAKRAERDRLRAEKAAKAEREAKKEAAKKKKGKGKDDDLFF